MLDPTFLSGVFASILIAGPIAILVAVALAPRRDTRIIAPNPEGVRSMEGS